MIGRSLVAMLLAVAAGAQAQPGPAEAPADRRRAAEEALAAFNAPRLTTFTSDDELFAYLDAAEAAQSARRYGATASHGQYASLRSDAQEQPPCPEDDPECLETTTDAEAGESVMVTGSRIPAPSNPSITNNQMAGVEEGDIVKQINHFLVVLQDGRLFVIDTRGGGTRRLLLSDRQNVYRSRDDVDWYDEMLVKGDRILVTAYSYQQRATELSVFRLNVAGRLEREGVFYLSSNDYYDSSNYATRLVGDNLVVYTPIALRELTRFGRFDWPVARRWVDWDLPGRAAARGTPLLNAQSIYRPVRTTYVPYIHTVSVCPLATVTSAQGLQCRSTAFIGPQGAEFYVTDDDAYLWTVPGWEERRLLSGAGQADAPPCSTMRGAPGAPATLFRMPVGGAAPGVLGVTGTPPDQFSLEASRGMFRALVLQEPVACEREWREGNPLPLEYVAVPLGRFSQVLSETPRAAYTGLPSVGTQYVANRFSEDHLVYGPLRRGRRGRPGPAYAVPLDRPQNPVKLDVRHTVIRAERAGPNMVLTGYENRTGLDISLIDLRGRPEIASTLKLRGRAESENRSHAFNSLIEENGGGLMGLPTVPSEPDERYPWRSDASDISFVEVNSVGELADIGRLRSRVPSEEGEEVGDPSYRCEVSCIDWYGNSRPIFTNGRIFALTGNELIEGRLRLGQVRELQRLDLTRPVGTQTTLRAAEAR